MDKRDIEKLLAQPAQSPAEQELRAWLEKCRAILEGRDVYEVAQLAIMVGMDRLTVYSVLSHFDDAMADHSPDRRIAMQTMNHLAYLDAPELLTRKTDWRERLWLKPLWDEVIEYQTGEAA